MNEFLFTVITVRRCSKLEASGIKDRCNEEANHNKCCTNCQSSSFFFLPINSQSKAPPTKAKKNFLLIFRAISLRCLFYSFHPSEYSQSNIPTSKASIYSESFSLSLFLSFSLSLFLSFSLSLSLDMYDSGSPHTAKHDLSRVEKLFVAIWGSAFFSLLKRWLTVGNQLESHYPRVGGF